LETGMNYLQSVYNTSRHFLKNLLHYCVKRKSFKCCNYSTNPWSQNCAKHYDNFV